MGPGVGVDALLPLGAATDELKGELTGAPLGTWLLHVWTGARLTSSRLRFTLVRSARKVLISRCISSIVTYNKSVTFSIGIANISPGGLLGRILLRLRELPRLRPFSA